MRATNCNDCGCLPCCCVTNGAITPQNRKDANCRKTVVRDSVGDCVPVLTDPLDLINNKCCPAQGGDKTIGAPVYSLVIENPLDSVLRDENGAPILINGEVVAR